MITKSAGFLAINAKPDAIVVRSNRLFRLNCSRKIVLPALRLDAYQEYVFARNPQLLFVRIVEYNPLVVEHGECAAD